MAPCLQRLKEHLKITFKRFVDVKMLYVAPGIKAKHTNRLAELPLLVRKWGTFLLHFLADHLYLYSWMYLSFVFAFRFCTAHMHAWIKKMCHPPLLSTICVSFFPTFHYLLSYPIDSSVDRRPLLKKTVVFCLSFCSVGLCRVSSLLCNECDDSWAALIVLPCLSFFTIIFWKINPVHLYWGYIPMQTCQLLCF